MARIQPPPGPCPSARQICRAPAGALLALCGTVGIASAADLPAASTPAPPAIGRGSGGAFAGPAVAPPGFVLRHGFHFGDGAAPARPGLSVGAVPATGFADGAMRLPGAANLSDVLIGFMEREALRCRRQNVLPAFDGDEEADSFLAEERSRQAGRILTRSFKRAARMQLEQALRSSDAFGSLFDRSWDLAGGGRREGPGTAEEPRGPGRGAGGRRQDGPTASLRFRLDAHPRLIVDTALFGGRGRVELPLRNEPLRVSYERPVGPRGRAILSAGLRPDGPDTTSLTFGFSF